MPDDPVARLYTAPPDGFVAARAEAVAAARAAGDAVTARELAKLRRPTTAAWLVNLLAHRRPDLVAGLVELSGALRAAQRDLRGPRLRELSARRRELVHALVTEAAALAAHAAPGLRRLPLAEVEATLTAALSEPEVAERVRSGRLVRATAYAGFGEVPRPQLRLVTGSEPAPAEAGREPRPVERKPKKAERNPKRAEREAVKAEREAAKAQRARRAALDRQVADARAEQDRAEAELARAVAAERAGAETLAEVEAALAEWKRRRAEAGQEVDRLKLARKGAERAAARARRRLGEAQAAAEAADRRAAEPAGAAPDGGAR